MSGQQKQLYHCDRCGEVFRSSIKIIAELKCTECGAPPVRDGFMQLAQMPTLDASLLDSNRGIAGKDEADFFSMGRKKKQQRAILMYACWFVLLLTALTLGYYVKTNRDDREAEREAINQESTDYEKRKKKALVACLSRFQNFSASNGENQKAEHVYNGTDYLLGIRKYYREWRNKEEYRNKKIRVIRAKLVEKTSQPSRMEVLMKIDYEDRYDQFFEAVFWKKNDKWYLDWPQFTRVGELSWSDYLQRPEIDGEYQFRLYARKRRSEFIDNSGYTELVFSKAFNMKDKPSGVSSPILVKQNTELEKEILKYIETVFNMQLSDKDVLGYLDPRGGQARVNVRVAYEEVNGQRAIVLKELISKNWFSELDGVEEVEEAKK